MRSKQQFSRRSTHLTLATAIAGALTGFGPKMYFDKDGTEAPPAAPPQPFKAMREEYSTLHTEADTLFKSVRQGDKPREYTAEEKTAQEGRFTRMRQIKDTLEEANRFATLAISGDISALTAGTIQTPADAPGRDEFNASEGRTVAGGGKKPAVDREEFSRALTQWGASGEMPRKFATITTATASSALLPKQVDLPIVPTALNVFREGLVYYGLKPVTTNTTANLSVPVMSATAGGVVAENASSETTNEPTLTDSINLNVSTYQSGTAYLSNMVLAANDYDLVEFVTTDLTYSKELGLESACVAAMIADAGITQVVATATTTGFTYSNLVDLNRALPKKFDRLKIIILGSAAFTAAEKLVGDDGHPVLIKDPQVEGLVRFNGTPVFRSDYLEGLTANKTVGLCVSLLGFKLRDVTQQNLARYTQVPAKPNQTGFNLFAYHAYGYAPSAVAKLKTPAS